MDISQHGLDFVATFEGGQSSDGLFHAYWDPYGRVWTIGYGETEGVHSGMTWTKAQAENDLKSRMVREYEPAIKGLGVPLNQNQFDALCSFVWNLGPGSMQWDVGRLLRQREYAAAANAMLQYDRAGGVVLAGLSRRRQAERALFLTKPAPDYHYERYPKFAVRCAGGIELHEEPTVKEYDRLIEHPKRNATRIRVLRAHMVLLQRRLELVGHWDLHYRRWRWRRMADRQHGRATITN